ncbi:GGDEF domain-containing protein [Deinococcus knuensis]|uniref:GGDEF domain-containing protein n=1 Tax=Deinococcus knuensis TaxID=1837380 RepID=A0ABQ2SRS9_9DEIO|nr:GGDEF domain-containing protein [Deinococcus knuensis]GGS38009.1 GGDEF domain-containing protein [Deinococcus knuensis]
MYLWVSALAAASQLMGALVIAVVGAETPLWWPLAGGSICLAAWILLRSQRLPWQWVDHGILGAASLIVSVQLATQEGPLTADTLFGCVFLLLAGFSILPLPQAMLYVAAVLSAVGVALLVHGGPYSLFWNLALAGLLTAHLSTFGRNISIERAETRAFEALANTDTLTGLENRRAMLSRVQAAFTDEAGAAVLLIDIDRFKRINDHFGHDVGDRVLRDVAVRLEQVVGVTGHVARWGGEEFLVLVPGGRDAQVLSEELVQRVRAQQVDAGITVTVSVGGAARSEVTSLEDWLRLADARLYAAKEHGRDRAELASPALRDVLRTTVN